MFNWEGKNMIYTLICSLLIAVSLFSKENIEAKKVSVNEMLVLYDSIEKFSFSLPNEVIYTYHFEGDEIRAISSINLNTNESYSIVLPETELVDPVYLSNFYDFVSNDIVKDHVKGIYQKQIADIFSIEYIFDQYGKIKTYRCLDNEVFYFSRDKYISKVVCSRGLVEERKKFILTKHVLGEMDSYVLKDFNEKIILVVMDNKPYLPVLDKDGSLRKILDIESKEVVATIDFSSDGHVVSHTGGQLVPFCFRGMYQEKHSELYFDVGTYYDADVARFLVWKEC
ncbi:MAG: hypothetical protein S4CHLAM20_02830 [Chlamydiia bacterium]|nr:hypothetical protein [Chlamydiia bacterium]